MYAPRVVPLSLTTLAEGQGGLVTSQQAQMHVGRTPLRRLIASGQWRRVTRGIYAIAPETPTDQQRLWAGHLVGGAGSAIGGRGALFLAGLVPAPETVEVWIPRDVVRADHREIAFRRDCSGRLAHVLGTLPRIRTEEALIDVAQSLGVEAWVALLAEAVRVGAVSLPGVLRRIESRTRLTQRAMLLGVAHDLSGIESSLEWIYRADVERAHSLPAGARQVSVLDGWRCDVRYGSWSLIVELDGRHHLTRVFRDLDRDNQHAVHGSATLRYGSVDLRGRPCAVADQVATALANRGWPGDLTRCPRCPPA